MIRRATAADAPAVAQVHAAARAGWAFESLSAATDEATWAERLAGTDTETYVLERDGAVRGFLSVWGEDATTGRVLALYVDPAAQGTGVGSALLDAVAAGRRTGGDTALVLWTDEANAAARAFYERRGWRLDQVDGAELRYRLEL